MGADEDAEDRDRAATLRDKESEERDRKAEARDAKAEARRPSSTPAASDRAGSGQDRRDGARDRSLASDDRDAAAVERSDAASDRAAYLIDELTGAYRRDAGALELEREIEVAKRTDRPFVIAFVDVDGLKARNDTQGHAAGDELLKQVVAAVRRHTRSYDVIVRYGGDEFVCGLLEVGLDEASERFAKVDADILDALGASITTGLAVLSPHDGLDDLIRRADEALYRIRGLREEET